MTNLVLIKDTILPMKQEDINKVYELEVYLGELPQVDIKTVHTLHGGIYCRTVMIPAGVAMAGALIKISTTLIISGKCAVFIGDEAVEFSGYNIVTAGACRKQAVVAIEDTHVTMLFPTSATSVEQAEEEFTDEVHKLLSRKEGANNTVKITGEQLCLAAQ